MNEQLQQNDVLTRYDRQKLITKEIVRKSAVETFLELGYLKTTVKDIMDRANLGYGTFYQYYKSKLDVIVEIATETRENLEIITRDYKKPPATERSIYQRSLFNMLDLVRTFSYHREVLLVLRDCHTVDEELRRLWLGISSEPLNMLKRNLIWSMRRGLCTDFDLETAVVALGGMMQAVINYTLERDLQEEQIVKMSKDVARFFVKSVFIVDELPVELLEKNEPGVGWSDPDASSNCCSNKVRVTLDT